MTTKTIQVQITLTLDETAAKSLAEVLGPAIRQAIGLPTSEQETRIKASRKAIFGGNEPPEDQGLLVDSKEAARLLKVSPRKLWDMQTTGQMPPPLRIGKAVRWSIEVLKKWIEAGCPAEP